MNRPQLDTPLDPRHLRERVEDDYNEKLRNEYQSIQSYMPSLQDLPPGTKAKNRYVNVLPNDATRVPLAQRGDDPTSTFINANYVSGYNGLPKHYIATQGPLPDTMNDFWRMIWEESIMCIVMTTGLIEGKRRKCDRYWPDTAAQQKQVQYGDVTVEVIDEVDYSGIWVLSTFNVSKGNETRQAKHFWYTGWPDHGVPETACDVIEFLRAVKRETETNTAPILVHCSAGIGRTGTFMAIDIGMQELQSEWRVTDIKGNVEKMRKERGGSVQTPIQYKFIHQALEEYCKPGQKHSMFGTNKPRSVVLQTSNQYPYLGFTARGSHPAFVVSVDVGGLAELQGVRAGDHILEINGINAMQLSHKQTVEKIKQSGSQLAMTLVSKSPY